jgi:hypothetical protein
MTLPARLDDITIQTIQSLVDQGVRERKFIEYKRDLPDLKAESHKKEFLNDVASFANASGGDLVFGIEVDKEQKDLPTKVVGIPVATEDALQLQIQGIVTGGLDPRVPKFETHFVPTAPGRGVLVLRVGKSWRGPHMVKETGRFFSRTSSGKFTLDVREIRDAMLAGEEIGKRMANFRAERIAAIMANEAPQDVGKGPKVIAHLLPEASFHPGARVDLGLVGQLPLVSGPSLWPTRHNFDGVATAQTQHDGSPFGYTQMFRNGVVEGVECTWLDRSPDFPAWIDGFLLQFTEKCMSAIEQLGLGMPIYAAFTFVGVRGFQLSAGSDYKHHVRRAVPLRMSEVLLPEQRFESADDPVAKVLRPAFDVLWNAFGLPRCPNYGEDGRWIGEES